MTRKHNIIVVGAGLFGSIAATLARKHGHNVTVIGEHRQYEASPASGCVLAPSWLSSMEKPAIADALAVLGELYLIQDLEFKTNLFKTFKAQRVSLSEVLVKPDLEGCAVKVGDGYVDCVQTGDTVADRLRGKVLIAAGIWCRELLPGMPVVRGLYGCSLKVPGQLDAPRIHAYAPYKQAVGFNLDRKHVWFGDGTALIEKTWAQEEPARVTATAARAAKMIGATPKAKVTAGARPVVEGHKAGYFERVYPNTWVSTGGAKNGTVLAAAQALAFVRSLK